MYVYRKFQVETTYQFWDMQLQSFGLWNDDEYNFDSYFSDIRIFNLTIVDILFVNMLTEKLREIPELIRTISTYI